MKVLIVGQLPKEMGGHYTTGIARVIGELSKHHFGDADVVVYGTNISNKKAIKLNVDANQACVFAGYKINPLGLLVHAIRHPKMTIKALIDYKVHGGASMLHLEFFRYNFSGIIDEVKPDLIHYHGSGFIAMYHANKKYGVPILLTLHGLMWSGIDSDDPKEIEWKRSSELILPLAKRYTTLNENALKKMLKLGVKREQVDIIPNGVDSDKFYYSEDVRKEFRKKFSVDEQTIVFITVGVVIDRKGQLSFLKILESSGIDYQYWIVGKGPDEEAINEYAKQKRIEDKVKMLGYIQDADLYQYHSAADVYAHASTTEGQALSEVEAYTTGLRVIVNEIISETVIGNAHSEKDRYLIMNFEKPNLSELNSWLNSEWKRDSTQRYDWGNIANKYADLYNEIDKNTKSN